MAMTKHEKIMMFLQTAVFTLIITASIFGYKTVTDSCLLQSKRAPNETEQLIIDNYSSWIVNNGGLVVPYLPPGISEKDMDDIIMQSLVSDYIVIEDCIIHTSDNSYIIASAALNRNLITMYEKTKYWRDVASGYVSLSKSYDKNVCVNTSELFWLKNSLGFNILCHENAHLVGIKNHDDVYAIGDACSKAVHDYYIIQFAENCETELTK